MENFNWSKVKKNGIQQQERPELHWNFFLVPNPALVIIFHNAIATLGTGETIKILCLESEHKATWMLECFGTICDLLVITTVVLYSSVLYIFNSFFKAKQKKTKFANLLRLKHLIFHSCTVCLQGKKWIAVGPLSALYVRHLIGEPDLNPFQPTSQYLIEKQSAKLSQANQILKMKLTGRWQIGISC